MDNLIYHSLTILNGINVLRGASLDAGVPHILSWLLFNKVSIIIVGVVQWLSYFQPNLYFKGVFAPLIIPGVYGLYKIVKSSSYKLTIFLVIFMLIAIPGGLFYPMRLSFFIWVGWLFWGSLTIYGISKAIKK